LYEFNDKQKSKQKRGGIWSTLMLLLCLIPNGISLCLVEKPEKTNVFSAFWKKFITFISQKTKDSLQTYGSYVAAVDYCRICSYLNNEFFKKNFQKGIKLYLRLGYQEIKEHLDKFLFPKSEKQELIKNYNNENDILLISRYMEASFLLNSKETIKDIFSNCWTSTDEIQLSLAKTLLFLSITNKDRSANQISLDNVFDDIIKNVYDLFRVK
jgi:hypothetical protein